MRFAIATLALVSISGCSTTGASNAYRGECPPNPNREEPCALYRVPPVYPEAAMRAGGEARVLLSYSVLADGSTDDVTALFSEGHPSFERPAVRAVRAWRYAPRTLNGVPQTTQLLRVVLPFRLARNTPGVIPERIAEPYQLTMLAIAQEDFQAARVEIGRLEQVEYPTLSEIRLLDVAQGLLAAQEGNTSEAYRRLSEGVGSNGRDLPPMVHWIALRVLSQAAIAENKFGNALSTLSDLVESSGRELSAPFAGLRADLIKLRDGHYSVAHQAVIEAASLYDPDPSWGFTPLRRTIVVDDFEPGDLREVRISCDEDRESRPALAGVPIELPIGARLCHVRLHGQTGATFSVVELPTAMTPESALP